MIERIEVLGINIDNITIDEGTEILRDFLQGDRLNMVFTPNSEIIIDAVKDSDYEKVLNSGQLVIPDGIGVVIASKFYKTPLKERVAGCDLMYRLIELAYKEGKSIYILGGMEGVAVEAADILREKYPGIQIAGVRNGYYSEDEEEAIVQEINEKNTDILLAALGAPKQEKFIYQYRDKLKVKVAMGVGGSLDILAGRVERAPEFYRKAGLEWFYRLLKQPERISRTMKLPKFIIAAFYDAKTR